MKIYPLFFLLLLIPNAYALELELNQKVYSINDKLVIFGKAIPNDSLIVELFNPTGNLILRTQLDVHANGEFATILLIWPEPDNDKFRIGTYTLVVTSSINRELSTSKVFNYQIQQISKDNVERVDRVGLELAVPPLADRNQSIPVIAYATFNDTPLIGLQVIKGSIIYPDGKEDRLEFRVIGDGLYQADFSSNIEGYHTILVSIEHQGLVANKAFIINIEDNSSIRREVDALRIDMSKEIDLLDNKVRNYTLSISNDVSSIKGLVENVSLSMGQLISLFLPIVGMIAIIVALQATILAKRR